MQIAFGDCLLDVDRRQLTRGGAPLPLTPKAFQLLRTLIDQRPRALSKEELVRAVWPGVSVADSSLSNLMTELRHALDDEARDPRFIRTVHGFGYAFDAPVQVISPTLTVPTGQLSCRLLWRSREIGLVASESVIGRAPDATVWLDDERVSRRHARIRIDATGVTLEDLGSRNGTFHRETRIDAPTPLADGDEIRIGGTSFVVRIARNAATTIPADGS